MNLHLAEIALPVGLGAHAVLLVDQDGWAQILENQIEPHRQAKQRGDRAARMMPLASPATQ
jgi:hypothetical protein